MPIQVIITGNDANEAMQQMANFIGMRGMPAAAPIEEHRQAPGNGATSEAAAETAPKKRAGRPKKEPEAAPEEEQQTGADVAAQDDADEAVQGQPAAATVDDVRAALNDVYVKRYGMEATQKDILKLYAMRFPDGSVNKASDIPEGMHAQVIEDITEMATKNPFKRARVDVK